MSKLKDNLKLELQQEWQKNYPSMRKIERLEEEIKECDFVIDCISILNQSKLLKGDL